jgi:hypothetical protein
MDQVREFFAQRDVVLVSMHGKAEIIAPVLAPPLGVAITALTHIDTDQFGAFTGEIPRVETQYHTAVAKARAGMVQGYTLGIASEGSFFPHPEVSWLTINQELVVLVDDTHGLVFEGWATSTDVTVMRQQVRDLTEVERFVQRVGFPDQGVLVRYHGNAGAQWYKDAVTEAELGAVVARMWGSGQCDVWLETDLRAHRNPRRRAVILQAAMDLLHNLQRTCVQCGTPGVRHVAVVRGLPCAWCGMPTRQPKEVIYACVRCECRTTAPHGDSTASPEFCEGCNP